MTPKEKILDNIHVLKHLMKMIDSFALCLKLYTDDCVSAEIEPVQSMIGTMKVRIESLCEYVKKLEDSCNEL